MAISMLDAALRYARMGIPVFPCGADKRPLTPHGFKDATTDEVIIRKRWTRWPNAMIAVPTGPVSGIAVMDLDKKNGKNGFKAVPDWRKRSPVISRTMSKGAHLFFQDDDIPSTTGKIADGVDTRGKGGYVIVPPSPGYKYINGHDLASPLPKWPADLRPPAQTPRRKGKRFKTQQPVEKEEALKALAIIDSDDYQIWFEVGCALYHEFGDDGFDMFDIWSKKSGKYKIAEVESKWGECQKISGFTAGTIFHYADAVDPKWRGGITMPITGEISEGATPEDFVANLAQHNYIYLPTNQSWPAASVNSRLGKLVFNGKKVSAASFLDKARAVQSITWSPGDLRLIHDRVMREEGGWIERKGDTTLNQYTPPVIKPGDARKAKRWVDLIRKLFPNDVEHILNWLAQRVQQPGVKVNHALVFGGAPGIGKDTIIEGVRYAIGLWNFGEASPKDVMARFNAHVKSVILRINEARDMGEFNRYDFYECTKNLTTAPPDTVPCEEKYMKRYVVANVVGVIYTTNHKLGGIYLPEGDRRHFVAWSNCVKEEFPEDFFREFYKWYREGGWEHITAFLQARDISKFDPKMPPPETEAWRDIIESNRATENQDFAKAIDLLGVFKDDSSVVRPNALSVAMVRRAGDLSFKNWLSERKNARAIPHRLEESGYVPVRNLITGNNRWRYRDHKGEQKEEALYVRKDLSLPKQDRAAKDLIEDFRQKEPKWLIMLRKNKDVP